MEQDTLTALLERTARDNADATAVTDAKGALDWRAFATLVEGYAGFLHHEGVERGERVALWLPNSRDYLALIFACARIGAIAVHVNTRFRSVEVGYLLRRSHARIIVTQWNFPAVDFPAILREVAIEDRATLEKIVGIDASAKTLAGLPVIPPQADGATDDRSSPEMPCLTFTTSGTTRGPKLVLHHQHSIASHARDVAKRLATTSSSAVLLAIPLCGTYGLAFAMQAVAGGAHCVLMDQFDGATAESLIRQHRITHIAGSDDMLGRIAAVARAPFDTLVFSGFARFTPTAAASLAAAQALAMHPRGLYGSSEMQALFAFAPDSRPLTDGGVPVSPMTEMSVRDPETGEPLPDGQDGELCLKAPSAFAGYLNDPAATALAITDDGFFRTGDLARLKQPGFIFQTRLGDGLRLGGFLVSPEEIESFLQTLPGVAEAQVVAVEHGGVRSAFAFARPSEGETIDEPTLLAACRESLARYKQPVRIVAIDAFPVTDGPNGVKIQRAKLRAMADAIMAGA